MTGNDFSVIFKMGLAFPLVISELGFTIRNYFTIRDAPGRTGIYAEETPRSVGWYTISCPIFIRSILSRG